MAAKRRRTPQEKKALSYERDRRDHYYDAPNVKFSRKLRPLRNAQEHRRRRRVLNARTAELGEMDDDVDADVIAGELEQDLGELGKRRNQRYGPTTLRAHVDRLEPSRERRRLENALQVEETCPTCGRRHSRYLGFEPAVRALIDAGASTDEVVAQAHRIAERPEF